MLTTIKAIMEKVDYVKGHPEGGKLRLTHAELVVMDDALQLFLRAYLKAREQQGYDDDENEPLMIGGQQRG